MPRFYTSEENVKGDLIHIDGQEARHILNVMRMKEGDKVVVFDGTGSEYMGFIKNTKPRSLVVQVVSRATPKVSVFPRITLAQAIPKKERMDNIVEKATELGVHSIIPVITERTVVVPGEAGARNKISRWKNISLAAAKQCGRTDIPEIGNVQNFYNLIDEIDGYDMVLMAHLSDNTIPLKEAISDFKAGKVMIFVGPEGDFTPDEITMAEKCQRCRFVTLGKRVMKSDTAGLYILSVLNYELSE